ncbi:hypothetical protein RF55_16499 [Lasius niger]|uniref:Uncharacterized protein n=1 Tax=Lasius niger TaxID=67767 RepID=A0A0J7MXJ2_LASNI|nr:hypothetical protein RF55_16499 [Lasius niger]
MEKLLFEFKIKPSVDGKSNIMCITSITTETNQTFEIPEECQSAKLHTEIVSTETFKKIKNTLQKRHQTRKVWIALTKEIKDVYVDKEGNIQFHDIFLEEREQLTPDTGSTEQLTKIMEKLLHNKQAPEQQNLSKISEKFVLEKFTKKNSNPDQWIDAFEKECERFKIIEDQSKIEIFRLFLDKSALDWYGSMMIKLTWDSEWKVWKEKFCETYANKGWDPIIYALSFRYKTGTLLEYAVRKEKLLLEIDRSMSKQTLINLIATGLPKFVLKRIDKEGLKEVEDLYNEVNKNEHWITKGTFEKKDNTSSEAKGKLEKKKPCRTCEKLNKGPRYHSESSCWFRTKDKEGREIKCTNNNELETELNQECQKN